MQAYLLANESTYDKLSTFTDKDAMDAEILRHRNVNKLTKTELAVLDVLARYSCVYPGVSYRTKNNIAHEIGCSRRTVIRVCNRLESLGIVKQHDLKRDGGDRRQSSNAIVIQPFKKVDKPSEQNAQESDVAPFVTPEMSRHKAQEPIKLLKPNKHNTDTVKSLKMSHISVTALKNSIPAGIYDKLSNFYDVDGVYKVYGILLRAKASIDRTIVIEDSSEYFTDTFMNVVRKYKRGEVRNFTGLLYSAWRNVTKQIVAIKKHAESEIYYDWLNESN